MTTTRARARSSTHCPRTAALLFLVPLASMAAACGDAPVADFRVESFDGVPHSIAADVPELGDVSLERLWEAPSEGELLDGSRWADPVRIAADAGGVAVLDPQLSQVHMLTPDGERGPSVGRRGGGPGELNTPGMFALHGDTIVIQDAGRPALELFSRRGPYIGSFAAIEGVSFGFYLLADGAILRSSMVPAAGQMASQWTVTTPDGERTEVEVAGDHPLQPHVADGGSGCWRRAAAGNHILELDCTFPLVRVVDRTGSVLREHRIDRAPERNSPEALEKLAEGMRAQFGGGGAPIPQAMIDQVVNQQLERNQWAQVMNGIVGTPSGHRIVLWEQLPEVSEPDRAVLHFLDAEGRYLARTEVGAALRSIAATDERLYLLVRDPDTDLKRLQAFRLP